MTTPPPETPDQAERTDAHSGARALGASSQDLPRAERVTTHVANGSPVPPTGPVPAASGLPSVGPSLATGSKEARGSALELFSQLDELKGLPLTQFAAELTSRVVQSRLALACGLWCLDTQAGSISLLADARLSEAIKRCPPELLARHEAWLRPQFTANSERELRWPWPGPAGREVIAQTSPIDLPGRRVALLETWRGAPGAGVVDTLPDVQEELARLLQLAWRRQLALGAAPVAPTAAVPPRAVDVTRQAASTPAVRPPSGPGPTPATPVATPVAKAAPVAPPPIAPPRIAPQSVTPTPVAPAATTPQRVPGPEVAQPTFAQPTFAQVASATPVIDAVRGSVSPEAVQAAPLAGTIAATPLATVQQAFADELFKFSIALQSALSVADVAELTVSDGRVLLACDRVTLLYGVRPRVVAVSGLSKWSRRSPWLKRLEALSRRVVVRRVPLHYPAESLDLPPDIEQSLAEFLTEAQSRVVHLVPLVAPVVVKPGERRDRLAPPRICGCLVAEQILPGDADSRLATRLDRFVELLPGALEHAAEWDRVWVLPLWRQLGRAAAWLRGRRLAWAMAWTALIAALVIVPAFVPYEYRVEVDGQLLPQEKRDVFAPANAEVAIIHVSSGDRVVAGQPLVQLKSEQLEAELVTSRTSLEERRKMRRSLQSQIDDAVRRGEKEKELSLFGELEEVRIAALGDEQTLAILEQRAADLVLRAPMDGVVSTFQLDQRLKNRPVQRGEALVTVMNTSGPWQLELKLDESRLGHVLREQSSRQAPLNVEYVLVTAPEQHRQAEVTELATRATVDPEGRVAVRVVARPTGDPPDIHRIGAEVRGRIGCGEKSLAYVLFGDVVEFVQRYFWW